MVLQQQRTLLDGTVECRRRRRGFHRNMVLHEDTIVQYREIAWLDSFAVGARFGRLKDDVIRLPFAGFARGVHERRGLPVNGRGLAVRIGWILE